MNSPVGSRFFRGDRLIDDRVVTETERQRLADDYRDRLDRGISANDAALGMIGNQYTVDWTIYREASLEDQIDTSVPAEKLDQLATIMNTVPDGFALNRRVERSRCHPG